MISMNRRTFLGEAACAAGMTALAGCKCPLCTTRKIGDRVPYGETIGDRLWMWGHHRDSFKALKGTKERYNLPYDTRIDMAPACKEMNIPGCFVVRWTNNPKTAELPEYMKQFADMKRIGFSITDSAVDTFAQKVQLGLDYADKMPNLTTLIMDDFWSAKTNTRSIDEIVSVKERMKSRDLKLGVVLYSDANEIKPEFKQVLDLCDEVTLWFWHGKNTTGIVQNVGKLRDLIGAEKPVLLGQYMWDFGGCKPLSGATMENQLAQTTQLLDTRTINGVIFHCTPLVDMGLDSVKVSKAWIAANANRTWGTRA